MKKKLLPLLSLATCFTASVSAELITGDNDFKFEYYLPGDPLVANHMRYGSQAKTLSALSYRVGSAPKGLQVWSELHEANDQVSESVSYIYKGIRRSCTLSGMAMASSQNLAKGDLVRLSNIRETSAGLEHISCSLSIEKNDVNAIELADSEFSALSELDAPASGGSIYTSKGSRKRKLKDSREPLFRTKTKTAPLEDSEIELDNMVGIGHFKPDLTLINALIP